MSDVGKEGTESNAVDRRFKEDEASILITYFRTQYETTANRFADIPFFSTEVV